MDGLNVKVLKKLNVSRLPAIWAAQIWPLESKVRQGSQNLPDEPGAQ